MNGIRLWVCALLLALMVPANVSGQEPRGTLVVSVRGASGPVPQADVQVGDVTAVTNPAGEVVLRLAPGEVEVAVRKFGFKPRTERATVRADATTNLSLELEAETVHDEEVVVTATRTGRRIQDEPLRVEVIGREEIEEAVMMTPGDIAMLLGETSGVRVQVTSPSLGAASVRVLGLRGRYTQILTDGLPLYGGQTGAIGLLQIPPSDLAQVEVIKGTASALYGPSALGGVINLVSRRPEHEPEREGLLNRTSRGGTDGVLWLSGPLTGRWGYTLLGGVHDQDRVDIDKDGWGDLAGYTRIVARPRFFWEDGTGRSLLLTTGVMVERRAGGTMPGTVAPDGRPFPEDLRTGRWDMGVVGRWLTSGGRLVAVRGAGMQQRHTHQFGDLRERDHHRTWFGELSLAGTSGRHTWVAGAALQYDGYRSDDVRDVDYDYTVPAIFAQNDYDATPWLTLAGSARLDFHSEYGSFLSPRVSALLRPAPGWTVRVSGGTGFFAPTPFTEETEATGLSRLLPLDGLRAERARSLSVDVGRMVGPFELNATLFGSRIRHAVALAPSTPSAGRVELRNRIGPTNTAGADLLGRYRRGPVSILLGHTIVRATEPDIRTGVREDVPLTPRHTSTMVVWWEESGRGRVGVELFLTGRQRLDENPYRTEGRPYPFLGALVEWRIGGAAVFVNGENLTGVRQTRHEPLVRPARGFDGRWTVDAWAPLDGRVINGGVRFAF